MSSRDATLSRAINYEFHDPSHLEIALTHRSAGRNNNERFEFLGDSLLGFLIAEALFERFPQATEGELTRLRATLVKGETLGEVGLEFDLGRLLNLGEGELKSGGWRRRSIIANAVEALIAAVYLDGGIDACRRLVLTLFGTKLAGVSPEDIKDAKTRLQEWAQARGLPLPVYETIEVRGEPHEQEFMVECSLTGIESAKAQAQAVGTSRRRAEQSAAQLLLNGIDTPPQEPPPDEQ